MIIIGHAEPATGFHDHFKAAVVFDREHRHRGPNNMKISNHSFAIMNK